MKEWNKLIVALDLDEKAEIFRVVKALAPKKVKFKIGSIAFTKFGPQLLKKIISRKIDIFLDLKLYDIPNTMKQTAAVIAGMGCWAFTVHIRAGQEALESVRDEVVRVCAAKKMRKPLILGVTELTSGEAAKAKVVELADQARIAGIDGVIASAQEASAIKAKFDNHLLVITPGIRNPKDDKGDQQRITTAQTAFYEGADYIVVGRPIISKKNYLKAAQEVLSA
ncbi:MAG: orotidine-5'-phosphate decarboxylase [Candidatus Omnitrophica bacterium]|nr:orotidine-5'-phosphate decarboxylase [Candidatus Omnitrophota bacterium]